MVKSSSLVHPQYGSHVDGICLSLAYDGTSFHGWARQRGQRTVEGVILEALSPLVGQVRLSVAGRTDTGVHARGQVASFTTNGPVDPAAVQDILNAKLAPEVVATSVRRAPDSFDARRSATAREYRYRIQTGPVPDPFTARIAWHRADDLSVAAMREAGAILVGHRDFASFGLPTSLGGQTFRDLQRLAIRRNGDLLEVSLRANAFLRHMVRSIVGTLVEVGSGRREPGEMRAILRAKNREMAAKPAPPHGLTLERVIFGARGRADR